MNMRLWFGFWFHWTVLSPVAAVKLPVSRRGAKNQEVEEKVEDLIFSIDAHSSKELRHFKFLSVSFVAQLLGSSSFIGKVGDDRRGGETKPGAVNEPDFSSRLQTGATGRTSLCSSCSRGEISSAGTIISQKAAGETSPSLSGCWRTSCASSTAWLAAWRRTPTNPPPSSGGFCSTKPTTSWTRFVQFMIGLEDGAV